MFKSHCPLLASFEIEERQVFVTKAKRYSPMLDKMAETWKATITEEDAAFTSLMAKRDLDGALARLSKMLEAVMHTACNGAEFRSGRCKATFNRTPFAPRATLQHALSYRSSLLMKALNRIQELNRPLSQYVRDKTWCGLYRDLDLLSEDRRLRADQIMSKSCIALDEIRVAFNQELHEQLRWETSNRICAWKRRMRASCSSRHRYLKAAGEQHRLMSTANGVSAAPHVQLQELLQSWLPILEAHRHREPSHDCFFQHYGHHLHPMAVDLPQLSEQSLLTTLKGMKNTAPGLDGWRVPELQRVLEQEPILLRMIRQLFDMVETHGVWPKAWVEAFVVMIPKSTAAAPSALEHRPISILSILYRWWARHRAHQLGHQWAALFSSPEHGGGIPGVSAEDLFLKTAISLESAQLEGRVSGGIAYDLIKAFDLVPIHLMHKISLARGLPDQVARPWIAMYGQLRRRFMIHGVLSREVGHVNGLLQGCPLSMLMISLLMGTWLAELNLQLPSVEGRVFADDLSAVANGSDPQELCHNLAATNELTQTFVTRIGGALAHEKCVTFGSDAIKPLKLVKHHSRAIRLLGGSIVARDIGEGADTSLQVARREKWCATVAKLQRLPVSWQERARVLHRTSTQRTYGLAAHICVSKRSGRQALQKLRSSVLRCLWRRSQYNSNPNVTLALLCPPRINPMFGFDYMALLAFHRVCRHKDVRDHLQVAMELSSLTSKIDGPAARLCQLRAQPLLSEFVRRIFARPSESTPCFAHDLREAWRQSEIQLVAKQRVDFAELAEGIDIQRSLHGYRKLCRAAEATQSVDHCGG